MIMTKWFGRPDLAMAIYAILMLCKLLIMITVPVNDQLGGDEYDYVGKARFLVEHRTFREIAPYRTSRDRAQGYSDFRPPGYSLFVSAFLDIDDTNAHLRRNINLAQFLLDLATTSIVLLLAYRFCHVPGYRMVAAGILGIQPWTSAFIISIYPDTMTTFLTMIGLLGLSWFVVSLNHARQAAALIGGSVFLSLTFLVRPEMILLVPVLVLVALVLARQRLTLRSFTAFGLLAAMPILAVLGMNMAYRWQVAHEVRIFGKFQAATPGLMLWTKTWIGRQELKEELIFGGLSRVDRNRFASLPDQVFTDDTERRELTRIVDAVKKRGHLTAEEDQDFMAIARNRIAADPMTYYVWTRLYNVGHFWVNLSNASHYLIGFSQLPSAISKFLTGSFLILKLVLLSGFILGVVLLIRLPTYDLSRHWHLSFLVLGITVVLMRTGFFAFYSNYVEFRYALVAWPFVLTTALYALARVWQTLTNRTEYRDGASRP